MDLMAFGSNAVFNGVDAGNQCGLWISNGTGGGTSEIDPTGDSASGLDPQFMTAFGNRIIFNGVDYGGHLSLWISDGSVGGTFEIEPAGAHPLGINPTSFTLFGNRVLFTGLDNTGNYGAWITDGTAAGTMALGIGEFDPANFTVVLDPFHTVTGWDFNWHAIASGDFNSDGADDVLWRNADGITSVWFMQNGQIFGTMSYGSRAGQNVITTGDVNHDGTADVMWQDITTGTISTRQFANNGTLLV